MNEEYIIEKRKSGNKLKVNTGCKEFEKYFNLSALYDTSIQVKANVLEIIKEINQIL